MPASAKDIEQVDSSDAFRCFTAHGKTALNVKQEGMSFSAMRSGEPVLRFEAAAESATLRLRPVEGAAVNAREFVEALQAVLEALTANDPTLQIVQLDGHGPDIMATLLQRGIAVGSEHGPRMLPELFWQLPDPWLPTPDPQAYPQQFLMTGGKRHPRRRPKPRGIVYSRYIPWLGRIFSFRTLDIDIDLERFNRWMNDPRVDYFWQEAGDLGKHRTYLEKIDADPHMMTLFGCLDGEPFCYFEIYWAKENRLAPYYDVEDYDRGWHVVVGEDAYRGRDYVCAWLPSLMHYLFLDDPRTQRIVGEPRADHTQQIRNLERSGFASIKEFDFPHKRAMLVMLLRERFFGERLWIPRTERKAAPAASEGVSVSQDMKLSTVTGSMA